MRRVRIVVNWAVTAMLDCRSSWPASGALTSTTMKISAPISLATSMGILLLIPPSTSSLPSCLTGGSAAGIDMLARMALARLPESRITASPLSMSVAIAR